MWFKLKRREFEERAGAANRRALKRQVERGDTVGLLAYERRRPVGWVAVEPRERYTALGRSRILAPVDEEPVWSITCFYVARDRRRHGLAAELLGAAVAHARKAGAAWVEGYPKDLDRDAGSTELFTGTLGLFARAGFREVARRSPTRPIVRLALAAR